MNVEMVDTLKQAFLKLASGRSDVVLALISAQCELNKLNLKDINIIEPPFEKIKMYHYLHARHNILAAKLEEVLTYMEQVGELKIIQDKVIQNFLNSCQK